MFWCFLGGATYDILLLYIKAFFTGVTKHFFKWSWVNIFNIGQIHVFNKHLEDVKKVYINYVLETLDIFVIVRNWLYFRIKIIKLFITRIFERSYQYKIDTKDAS